MDELVSCIITTHKRAPHIVSRAVQSILNQTYKNIEIIVVDDSPSIFPLREQVKKSVLSLDSDIKYIAHKTSQGACVARNTGLTVAKGLFIAYLDDDDEWVSDKIAKQIELFNKENIVLVYCGFMVKRDSDGRIKVNVPKHYSKDVFEKLILKNYVGSTSFPLIRKNYLVEIGGFDPLMKSLQDLDVWLRLAQKGKFACVNRPLVIYHQHEGDQISKNAQNKIDGLERLIKKNMDYFINHQSALLSRTIQLAPFYAQDLKLKKALFIWLKVVVKRPCKVLMNLRYFALILKKYVYSIWNS